MANKEQATNWDYQPKGRFDLQACPICGGAARWGFVPGEGPFVYCENHDEKCLTFEAARKSEAEVAARWNGRTAKGNGTPVLAVKQDGVVLFTALGLAFKWGVNVPFVRRMVKAGLLRPVGWRPYRFTPEEAERFKWSAEGGKAFVDYMAR